MTDHQQDTPSPIRFILLADLHLSDTPGTAAHSALDWAVETTNQEQPDFLAVAGDMTTFGTRPSTARIPLLTFYSPSSTIGRQALPCHLAAGQAGCPYLRGGTPSGVLLFL